MKWIASQPGEGAVADANSNVGSASATPSDIASAAPLAADLAWERFQEQAAIAFRAGDPINPPRLWAAALDIAERHFGRGDPRLASSLTNQALAIRRRRLDYQAQKLFREALDVWDDSWRWIHLMTSGRPSDAAPLRPARRVQPRRARLVQRAGATGSRGDHGARAVRRAAGARPGRVVRTQAEPDERSAPAARRRPADRAQAARLVPAARPGAYTRSSGGMRRG